MCIHAMQHLCHFYCSAGMPQSFPSKFSYLPGITGEHTVESVGSEREKQLVPMKKDSFCRSINLESESIHEHLRQLEVRVTVAERSNQALVAEMVQIQNDIK